MLASRNRLVSATDYRETVRAGRRLKDQHVMVYVARGRSELHDRYGFIVAKTVGHAPARNLVRRRLKSISHDLLAETNLGRAPIDVVIRALPGAAQASWVTLEAELSALLASYTGGGDDTVEAASSRRKRLDRHAPPTPPSRRTAPE